MLPSLWQEAENTCSFHRLLPFSSRNELAKNLVLPPVVINNKEDAERSFLKFSGRMWASTEEVEAGMWPLNRLIQLSMQPTTFRKSTPLSKLSHGASRRKRLHWQERLKTCLLSISVIHCPLKPNEWGTNDI